MRSYAVTALLFLVSLPAAPVSPKESLQAVIGRMDKAAADFKNMTANVTGVTHTDVINENTTESGNVVMEKTAGGKVRGLIHFLAPNEHTLAFENRRVRIYQPGIKTVQEWDLDKKGDQLDQFLMIGFGTSGTSLAKDYVMNMLGTEALKGFEGVQTIRLRLVPKAGEAKEYVKQIELWIPEEGDPYPLQEKISQPSGDYRLITYKDMKTNVALPPGALQLKLPPGVKTEYPGR